MKKTQFNPFAHPTGYRVPTMKEVRRICPTCLDPMYLWYAWWPQERTCMMMFRCDCGHASKTRLVKASVDKKGRVI